MKRVIIFPYKIGVPSAKRLQEELQDRGMKCLRVYSDGDYVPTHGDLIIVWGAGHKPLWWDKTKGIYALNHSDAICRAIDKVQTFKLLASAHVPTVPWTQDHDLVRDWINEGDETVLARKQVEGRDGAGIVLMGRDYPHTDNQTEAPLYTVLIPAKMEYRVHVFRGRAIIAQEKRPDPRERITSQVIKTGSNGWAFCAPLFTVPDCIYEASVRAVNALGLDFGGVDILLDQEDHARVLEVNTAPEIVGTDVETYADQIEQLM
jgi:glutathione synthase/RimK-type ligase-like ATP-grasp enzyme